MGRIWDEIHRLAHNHHNCNSPSEDESKIAKQGTVKRKGNMMKMKRRDRIIFETTSLKTWPSSWTRQRNRERKYRAYIRQDRENCVDTQRDRIMKHRLRQSVSPLLTVQEERWRRKGVHQPLRLERSVNSKIYSLQVRNQKIEKSKEQKIERTKERKIEYGNMSPKGKRKKLFDDDTLQEDEPKKRPDTPMSCIYETVVDEGGIMM